MTASQMRFRKEETALLLAAGAATVLAAAAFAADSAGRLEDVQIGERGDILRVALICSQQCEVVPGAGVEFRINGVSAALDVELGERSALARRLTITPVNGYSVVRLQSAARIDMARVVACRSDSGPAPCIEYRFEKSQPKPAARAPAAAHEPTASPSRPTLREDGAASAHARPGEPPFIGAIILAPQPSLRDAASGESGVVKRLSPPERFAPPPEPEPAEEEISALPAELAVGRPALIAVDRAAMLTESSAFDFEREARDILGKSFDVGACEGARARLMGDAWALDAMVDHAFCKAAKGKLEEADADLSRLLAYTPDNYEALVGRGLIALASGERETGLALLQDALNALPPIAESDRIVAAMRRN